MTKRAVEEHERKEKIYFHHTAPFADERRWDDESAEEVLL